MHVHHQTSNPVCKYVLIPPIHHGTNFYVLVGWMDRLGESRSRDCLESWLNVRAGSGEAGDLVSPPANYETSRRQALFNRTLMIPEELLHKQGVGGGRCFGKFPSRHAISSSLFSFLGFEKTGQDAHRTPLIVGSFVCLLPHHQGSVSLWGTHGVDLVSCLGQTSKGQISCCNYI